MIIQTKSFNIFRKYLNRITILTKHFYKRLFLNDVIAFEEQMQERIIAILAVLAIFFGLLTYAFLNKYGWIPDVGTSWVEKCGVLTFSMLVIGIIATLEWDAIILDSRDFANLNPLPVRTRSLLLAKFTSLCLFVGLFALSINSFSTLLFVAYLPHWQSSSLIFLLQFAVVHIVCMFLASFFAFFFNVFLIGSLMTLLGTRLFKRVSAYVRSFILVIQVFFLLLSIRIILYGVMDLKPLKKIADIDQFLRNLSVFFPPMWFTDLYETLLGNTKLPFHGSFYYAVFGLLIITGIFYLTTGLNYRRYLQQIATSEKRKLHLGKLNALFLRTFNRIFLANNTQRAIFYFFKAMIKSSTFHKMRLASFITIGIGLISIKIAILDMTKKVSISTNRTFLSIPLTLSFFVILGLREIVNMPISLDANWIFKITEKKKIRNYFSGLRKGIIFLYLMPLFTLFFIVYIFFFGCVVAFYHCVFGFTVAVLVMEVFFLQFKKIPFTCSYLPGKEKIQLFWLFYLILFFTFINSMSWIEFSLLQSPINFIVFFIVALLIIISIRVYQNLFFYKKESIKFEEEIEPLFISLKS